MWRALRNAAAFPPVSTCPKISADCPVRSSWRLFRVLQESLTNVHRHSKSRRADVSLRLTEVKVVLRVRDYGKGIPADVLDRFRSNGAHGGVGLAGMRERIHELGGQLEMDSDSHGTQVVATLPRSERKSSPDEVFAAD